MTSEFVSGAVLRLRPSESTQTVPVPRYCKELKSSGERALISEAFSEEGSSVFTAAAEVSGCEAAAVSSGAEEVISAAAAAEEASDEAAVSEEAAAVVADFEEDEELLLLPQLVSAASIVRAAIAMICFFIVDSFINSII